MLNLSPDAPGSKIPSGFFAVLHLRACGKAFTMTSGKAFTMTSDLSKLYYWFNTCNVGSTLAYCRFNTCTVGSTLV